MNGHIALHRKLLDNPTVCKDADHLAIWIWLLLHAVWDSYDVTFHGKRLTLKSGQLTAGRKVIANELKISESKVQRVLKEFESEHQIEQRTDRQCRLITIVSWDKYQIGEQRNEHQMNNDRTTSEQRVNTNKESNKENKENKVNTNTPKFTQEFQELWSLYPKKQGKASAEKKYVSARKSGTTFEEVKQGIEAYKEYIKARHIESQYIKQGSTFFSQKAWEDDWSVNNDFGRSNTERQGIRGTVREGIDPVEYGEVPSWFRPLESASALYEDARSEDDA